MCIGFFTVLTSIVLQLAKFKYLKFYKMHFLRQAQFVGLQ